MPLRVRQRRRCQSGKTGAGAGKEEGKGIGSEMEAGRPAHVWPGYGVRQCSGSSGCAAVAAGDARNFAALPLLSGERRSRQAGSMLWQRNLGASVNPL